MPRHELKPCPFCGSDDVTCDRLEDVYYVECWDCSAKVESYNGLEDAVAGWIQTLVGLSNRLRSYCEITAKLLRKVVFE